jgi:hypothetical protein
MNDPEALKELQEELQNDPETLKILQGLND